MQEFRDYVDQSIFLSGRVDTYDNLVFMRNHPHYHIVQTERSGSYDEERVVDRYRGYTLLAFANDIDFRDCINFHIKILDLYREAAYK